VLILLDSVGSTLLKRSSNINMRHLTITPEWHFTIVNIDPSKVKPDFHMVAYIMAAKTESRSFSKASFIIVYTCKSYINLSHSLIIIIQRIFSSKMLPFG
jgi:hypothetical protein